MAASLGPWIVLLAGLLLDPGLRRRLGWRRAWPVIPPVAGGCLLLALSESGSTFALMAALLVICAGEVWRMVHAPRPSQLVMVALVLLSVASVLGYAISQLGSGQLKGRIDCSWGLRGLDPHGPHTQPFRSAQRRRRGWPRPVIPDHDEPLVGPTNPQNPGRRWGSGAWPSATTRRRDCWRCGAAGRASDGGGGHRTLLGRPARPVRARLVARRRGRDDELFALSPVWLFLGVVLSWDRLFPRAALMKGR